MTTKAETTSAPFSFPQPDEKEKAVRYVRVEEIKAALFQPSSSLSLFKPGKLVWVCKSKGLRKGSKRKHIPAIESKEKTSDEKAPTSRMELFLRARVLKLEDDRIRVEYPKGATYACQKYNLLPVLEDNKSLILVAAETSDYRRCCVVHTLPTENFMEIGCDYGITVDRIRRTGNETVKRQLWGVDKSSESIGIANERYPEVPFFECDVLESPKSDWPRELQQAEPHVIAVDINGNRELEAVCQCLQVLLRAYQPRLIIVKSRALHAKVPLHS